MSCPKKAFIKGNQEDRAQGRRLLMAQLNFSSASSMRAFPEQDKTVEASSQDALFTRVDGERSP